LGFSNKVVFDFHKSTSFSILKSELRVEPMGVFGRQRESTKTLQFGMLHDFLHQQFRDALSSVIFVNKHVAEVGKGAAVGYNSGKTDLPSLKMGSKTKGIFNAFEQRCLRSMSGPAKRLRNPCVISISNFVFSVLIVTSPATAIFSSRKFKAQRHHPRS
jgi:hypothetical protein